MKKKVNPQEEIKNYSLKQGDYSITVKILEANDLVPKGKSLFGASALCSGQVEVQVHKNKKLSKIVKKQANPVFNQGWTFYFKNLKLEELQDMAVKLLVYDKSSMFNASIIGVYELDISSIYFQHNHEYYHTWLTLTDPSDEIEGATGYLFVNVSVLGPKDEPVIHDIESAKKATSGKEKALVPTKVEQTGHQIEINIYRAENLPCLDSNLDGIDAFIVAKFGSVIKQTSVVLSRNPEWNQCIKLQCMLPCQSKQITLALYDQDFASDDDLVGQIKINLADIQYKKHVPRWANLYGAPTSASGKEADLMNFYGSTLGSHYRGRLLYSCSSYNKAEPKTVVKNLQFSFPNNPSPQTKMRSYLLWVDVLEGNEIPDKNSDMIVHASIGPYMLATQPKINISGQVNWFESLEERKVIFPDDPEQIPDLIFYVTDQNREDRRMSFNRIAASKILRTQTEFNCEIDHETILVELKEDRSLDLVKDDEFAGFLIVKVSLLKFRPKSERVLLTEQQQLKLMQDRQEYDLRVQLYQGRGLPPADETGGCDPFVKIKCAGKIGTSKAKQKTLNPGWFETINIQNVSLPSMESIMKTKYPTKGMFLTVYDCDESLPKKEGGFSGNNFLDKIDTFNLKKKIGNLYSKILNKPAGDDVDDKVEGNNNENASNNNNSKIMQSRLEDSKVGLTKSRISQADQATPQESDSANMSLNDSGIFIADPDKVDKDLIGRIWIPLEAAHVRFKLKSQLTPSFPPQMFDILYRRPKWYPVKYDATGEYTGQLLLSYTLIPSNYSDIIQSRDNLYPRFEMKTMSFFLIGVREIDQEALGVKLSKIMASLDVSGDSAKAYKTDEMKVVNGGGNANQYVELKIQVPLNKSFDPVLDIFLWDCSRSEPYSFLGYGSLAFKDVPFLKYSKAAEDPFDIESEMSLVDCLKEAIFMEKRMASKLDEEDDKDKAPKEKKARVVYERKEEDNPKTDTRNHVNLQDHYINKKDMDDVIMEETEDIEDEEKIKIINTKPSSNSPTKEKKNKKQAVHIVEEEFEVTDVREKSFDGGEIIVSSAYKNKDPHSQPQLITNLPLKPLDFNKKSTGIIDLRDKDTFKDNEFIMQPPILATQPDNANETDFLNPKQDQNEIQGGASYQNNKKKDFSLKVAQNEQDQNKSKNSAAENESMNELNITNNSEQHAIPLTSQHSQPSEKQKHIKKPQDFEISTFAPPDSLSFSVKTTSKKSLHFEDMPKEGKIVKEEDPDDQKKGFNIDSKSLALFRKKGGIQVLEYEDFDTDDDEDLDVTPEWKKNREIFLSEFEDKFQPSKKLTCIPIMRGQSRGAKKDLFSFDPPEEPTKFAMLKCLFVDSGNPEYFKKVDELKKLLKERSYYARIYITRGKNIGGEGASPDSYLILKMGDKIVDLKEKTKCENTNNPDYYIQHDFECKLPGSASLEVQVWDDVMGSDEMIGKTVIDMENRLFTGKWLQYERKPFENRNIFPENESVSKGNLELWVELIPKATIKANPPLPISRPARNEYEIRVIVWETKDCVFKDEMEKCNDVYVRIGLQNKSEDAQETDIHWRCRSNGFFNWRMKFKQQYPLTNDEYGGDKLFVQLLDKDIVMADDIIGSCIVDLNQHKLIDKCVKRQKSVVLQLKELNRKAKMSDKIWYQVYNPLVRDKANKPIIQGQVCLSVEILPVNVATTKSNGLGRDSPNNFPPLSDPPGRMKFDLLHPLDFLKTLVGPELFRKVCGSIILILCLLFLVTFGWVFCSQLISTALVG